MNKIALFYRIIAILCFLVAIVTKKMTWFFIGMMWLGAAIRQSNK